MRERPPAPRGSAVLCAGLSARLAHRLGVGGTRVPLGALVGARLFGRLDVPADVAVAASNGTDLADAARRFCIVGSGPAGMYAADRLLAHYGDAAHVDVLERLPTPSGSSDPASRPTTRAPSP